MEKTFLSKLVKNLNDQFLHHRDLKGRAFMRVETLEIGKRYRDKIMDISMRELLAADIYHTYERELEWRKILDKKFISEEEIYEILEKLANTIATKDIPH